MAPGPNLAAASGRTPRGDLAGRRITYGGGRPLFRGGDRFRAERSSAGEAGDLGGGGVAAGADDRDPASEAAAQHRGERGRAGALREGVRVAGQQPPRGVDLVVVDE